MGTLESMYRKKGISIPKKPRTPREASTPVNKGKEIAMRMRARSVKNKEKRGEATPSKSSSKKK